MRTIKGEEFLNSIFPNLHYSKEVMITASKSDEPIEKITKYLDRIERIIERIKEDKSKIRIVKQFFYDKYLAKDLPKKYIEIQKVVERKESFTEEEKKVLLQKVRNGQKESLDKWFDFLITEDYPIWFKYYILRGLLKSGIYDKSINKITRRTKTTVEPFLELNEDVISNIFNYITENYGNNEKLYDELSAFNFQKLYVYYIERAHEKNNDGIWVKFEQNSDATHLINSIVGKNTGWCTIVTDLASYQLSVGDFYIYFTKDRNGEYSIPRIAIRMEGNNKIREIRGIGGCQNIEREMFEILVEKVKNFSCSEEFLTIIKNYRLLNSIEDKMQTGEELTNEELCCLYDIGDNLNGFGFSKERRVDLLRSKRDIKKDLNRIFKEVDCSDKCLYLDYLQDVEGIIFPESFSELDLSGLKTLEHLKLGDKIKGSIYLNGITEIKDYSFPTEINGSLEFASAKRISNAHFPEMMKGNLLLSEVTEFNNVVFPKRIGGFFSMSKIKELDGFVFPHCHSISFRSLESLKNAVFQEELDGSIFFSSLSTIENVIMPRIVKDQLVIDKLESTKGMELPSQYVGSLDLKKLTDVESLVLPAKVDKLFLLHTNIADLITKIVSCDINHLYAEKYYNKEDIQKALEEYHAKKLVL